MSSLAQLPQAAHGPVKMSHHQTSHEVQIAPRVTDHQSPTRQKSSSLHKYLQLGFAKVTGLVSIHTPPKGTNSQAITPEQDRVLRIQVQMPTWLCASVLDTVFSRSYAGWTCSLNVYAHLLNGSVEFHLALKAISDDDVGSIHRLFQERRCSPLDHLVWGRTDSSLIEVSEPGVSLLHLTMTCGYKIGVDVC